MFRFKFFERQNCKIWTRTHLCVRRKTWISLMTDEDEWLSESVSRVTWKCHSTSAAVHLSCCASVPAVRSERQCQSRVISSTTPFVHPTSSYPTENWLITPSEKRQDSPGLDLTFISFLCICFVKSVSHWSEFPFHFSSAFSFMICLKNTSFHGENLVLGH